MTCSSFSNSSDPQKDNQGGSFVTEKVYILIGLEHGLLRYELTRFLQVVAPQFEMSCGDLLEQLRQGHITVFRDVTLVFYPGDVIYDGVEHTTFKINSFGKFEEMHVFNPDMYVQASVKVFR